MDRSEVGRQTTLPNGCTMAEAADERTPLLSSISVYHTTVSHSGASPDGPGIPRDHQGEDHDDVIQPRKNRRRLKKIWTSLKPSTESQILLAGFLITLSFSFTQVP